MNLFIRINSKRRPCVVSGRLGSASSSSSCGSAEYTGEVIPHHPGIKYKWQYTDLILCAGPSGPD